MELVFKGKALVVRGSHLNLDRLMNWYSGMDAIPPAEIVKSFLINGDAAIPELAGENDIVIGGRDFGCGKGHFSFWIALKELGIHCIVAESFATQMFTGAVTNKDIYLVEVPGIAEQTDMGDLLEVDFENAVVRNLTKGTELKGMPQPEFVRDLMKGGGQLEYIRRKVEQKKHAF